MPRRRLTVVERLAHDEAVIARLSELGEALCALPEVARILGVSEKTMTRLLERHLRPRRAYEAGRAQTLAALRRAQIELARTNAAMAIKLGKTYLGQGDDKEAQAGEAIDIAEIGRRVRARAARLIADDRSMGDRNRDPDAEK
jgi:hypothetical protein